MLDVLSKHAPGTADFTHTQVHDAEGHCNSCESNCHSEAEAYASSRVSWFCTQSQVADA